MSFKVLSRLPKSLSVNKVHLYQSFTNNLGTNSRSKVINTNFLKSQLKEAAVSPPTLSMNVFTNTSLTNGKLQRQFSNEAHDDIPLCLSELQGLLRRGNSALIDVRTEEETWRTGVLPGSICIPLPQLEKALKMSPEEFLKKFCSEKPSMDDTVVFVCKRGSRSFTAAKKAKKLGYEKVHSIQGGFIKWLDRQRRIRELQQAKECESEGEEKIK